MLITNEQLEELVATLADMSGLDPELVKETSSLVREKRYDEAVSRAFVVLEERLRSVLRKPGGQGVNLSENAFAPSSGVLVDRLDGTDEEVRGIRDLFTGSFRAFRNPAAHTIAGYSLREAQGIIHLVSLLLLKLEEVQQPAQLWMPKAVSVALTPDARQGLIGFLRSLQKVGVGRGRGKTMTPYSATLQYRPPQWDEPKLAPVTIFYVRMSRGEPALAFNSKTLSNVVGLDLEQLEENLLLAGCVRLAIRETPMRLSLLQHADKATFDRLYAIVSDLVEKHR